MKNAQLSRIISHSNNRQTDELYQPLRQAITKSSQSKQKKITRVLSPQPSLRQLKNSKISQKLRQFTPSEAHEMQNNIFIPASRRLIPTNDLQRVEGKKFVAVDINVHYNQPLTQQEFQQRHGNKKPLVIQTLYSVSSTPTMTKQVSGTESPKINYQTVNLQSSNEYQLHDKRISQQINQQASPPKLKGHAIFEESQEVNVKRESEPQLQAKPIFSKYYGFSEGGSQVTLQGVQTTHQNRKGKSKSTYKYNLFSALDEGTNTKCNSCWVDNQIIASKPSNKPWA